MAGKIKLKLDYVIDRLSHIFLVIGGSLIVLMMFLTSYGVLRRYLFNSPEPYSYEICAMCLLFSFVFAVSAVERLDRHIRVDIVSNRVSPSIQYVLLNIIAPLMGIFIVGLITWKSYSNAMFSLEHGEVSVSQWRLPLAPIKFMIPLGFTMFILVLLARLYKGFSSLKSVIKKKVD